MRYVIADLRSTVPYSSSRMHDAPKLEKEKPDDYDARTWMHKGTFNEDGILCIPQMAFKFAVDEAVKRLGLKIPGRGQSTYSKYFVAGQICEHDLPTGAHQSALESIEVWANADGVRGSGKRVRRRFPYVRQWSGRLRFLILDETIPNKIFEQSLIEAGRLIGVGRFRPEKGGLLGRFAVDGFHWGEG